MQELLVNRHGRRGLYLAQWLHSATVAGCLLDIMTNQSHSLMDHFIACCFM